MSLFMSLPFPIEWIKRIVLPHFYSTVVVPTSYRNRSVPFQGQQSFPRQVVFSKFPFTFPPLTFVFEPRLNPVDEVTLY